MTTLRRIHHIKMKKYHDTSMLTIILEYGILTY